jgi:hypothetical protein
MEHQLFLQLAQSTTNLTPQMGLGTPAWDPNAGLAAYRNRQRAQGLTAAQRMGILQSAGVTDRAGMYRVFQNMHASPYQAFMMNGGKK